MMPLKLFSDNTLWWADVFVKIFLNNIQPVVLPG